MVFNHRVKFNGVLYQVGQNVPIEDKKAENKQITEPKEVVEINFLDEFAEKEIVKYTKTEINRMSTADLKKLAKSEGIKKAETMSGAKWNTGRRKRLMKELFTESEIEAIYRLHKQAYSWYLVKGVTEEIKMTLNTYHLWHKLANFCYEL